ncbi:DUF6193 family natural product biosynthesis protein [Actinoplanes xinjiangensis]|uniref:DUF6193 family natural product biosynthesis protein n=1 Tax=Actinoplanes xinjiangensis TaxID=512350 RepID=UPI00403A38A7
MRFSGGRAGCASGCSHRSPWFFPFPTHGTLAFCRTPPASLPVSPEDALPFIVSGNPYQVYTPGYGKVLGEAATPDEAVALLAAHLPNIPPATDPA